MPCSIAVSALEGALEFSMQALEECLEMQQDEILAMVSIYDEDDSGQPDHGDAASSSSSTSAKAFCVLTPPPSAEQLAMACSSKGKGKASDAASAVSARLKLSIPINFATPRKAFIRSSDCAPTLTTWTVLSDISHLPPLELELRLPPPYPLHSPPLIDSATSLWFEDDLSQPTQAECAEIEHGTIRLRWLQRQIDRIWEQEAGKAECLMMIADWLAEGMWNHSLMEQPEGEEQDRFLLSKADRAETQLQAMSANGQGGWDTALRFTTTSTSGLPALLSHFSQHRTLALFSLSRFNCSICLESVKGRLCTRLSGCGHVFCTPCLQDYISMLVREGSWRPAMECPDPDCAKVRADRKHAMVTGDSTAGLITRDELLALVGEELLKRHDWLQIKSRAETDPHASYCPITMCGGIARGEAKDAGTWSEGLRICTSCSYAFCRFCENAWHAKEPCTLLTISALIEEYEGLEEGSAEKKAFELKYGVKNIQRIIKIYQEESQNRKWIQENSTRCPSCNVPIEKSEGCNHMSCRSCGGHFCFLCAQKLQALNPYKHYNTPGTPCYQKLFHGQAQNEDDLWEPFDEPELVEVA